MNQPATISYPEETASISEITQITSGESTETFGSERSEFMRPKYQFKGAELFPFTYGYKILFTQVRDREDTGLFTWYSFIFMLWKKKGETEEAHRKWMIKIAWQIAEFREALVTWMDKLGPFTPEDDLEAKRIFEESMAAAAKTEVEVVPSTEQKQKKTRRQKKL